MLITAGKGTGLQDASAIEGLSGVDKKTIDEGKKIERKQEHFFVKMFLGWTGKEYLFDTCFYIHGVTCFI